MRLRARGRPLVVAVALLTGLAGLSVGAQPAAAAERVVLSKGHTDAVDVHLEDGVLSLQVHDDTVEPAVSRDPADVIFHALPASAAAVPDHPDYAFLGPAGSTIWLLPQIQNPDLLWPGWNTTTLENGVFRGDEVTISLVDVDGPGNVWVYMEDAIGLPLHQFRSDDGLPDALQVPVHTHAHANWAFGATGTYTLKFQADATLADGTPVSTGPVDYTFVVGDLTGSPPPTEINLDIYGLEDSYSPGRQVNLVAATDIETELDHFHWFSRCPGAAEFTVIAGEGSFSYQFTATEALNGCQYKAILYDDDHNAVAEADPVTLVVEPGHDPGEPGASQAIVATIRDSDGALVVSVDPDDRVVTLPAATLGANGDRLASSGALRPVTVTDTRVGKPGWNASGQVSDFVGTAGNFGGRYLGWAPEVIAQAAGQDVVAGPVAASGFTSGNGLASGALLGSAPSGSGRGTARLGAVVSLELPTDTAAGEYAATLTLTAI
ncbi:choice-of-anchor M domain-containing protein [Plantactinospora sp. WMMC1484]|uniref:choice-of-anchor M domain-containing protein n=1 Tax=Plantactinospora sp. WMMC1484 TaxID=3404122 RepID=UPI003BF5FF6B